MSRIGKRGTGNGAQGHCVLEDTKLEPIVLVRILWTWGAGAHTSTGVNGGRVTGDGDGGRGQDCAGRQAVTIGRQKNVKKSERGD
jgi:hypothetical protein